MPHEGLSAYIGLEEPDGFADLIRICRNAAEYAHQLFAFFRECDRIGIDTIYCQLVAETGIGVALMDRIRRAESR